MLRNSFILLIVSIVFFLLLLEGALRFINPEDIEIRMYQFSRSIIQCYFSEPDQILGWRYKRNGETAFNNIEFKTTIKTNSLGFRDDEFEKKKKEGATRIAFLGDSFAFGWGAEKNEVFSEQIEASSHKKIESYNFGVSGYSTLQEYLLFKHEVLQFNPDIAVIVFYDNDVNDNFDAMSRPVLKKTSEGFVTDYQGVTPENFQAFIHQDKSFLETGLKKTVGHFLKNIKNFFRQNSYAYNFISKRTKQLERKLKAENNGKKKETKWLAEEYILKKWVKLCQEQNIKLFIAIIPNKLEIQTHTINLNGGKIYKNPNRKKMVTFCKENKIPYLDVTEQLSQEEKEHYHYRLDDHFTPFGHRHYAQQLLQKIAPLIEE
ncbi:MAG: SGNH/GDSL hydrolase family protein [Nitrospinae bacterium]|nr:SGNH/GDSL hydrolase family protein [Nitrospinota bacterium]